MDDLYDEYVSIGHHAPHPTLRTADYSLRFPAGLATILER